MIDPSLGSASDRNARFIGNRRGEHEPVIVISMLADQIHTARRTKYAWRNVMFVMKTLGKRLAVYHGLHHQISAVAAYCNG